MTLLGLFKALSILASIALLGLMLEVGEPDKLWWWALAIPTSAWIAGPVWLPYWAARAFDSVPFTAALGLVFLLSTGFAASAYYGAFFTPTASTGALVLLFVPVFQWLGVLLAIALLAMRGNMRDGRG